MDPDSLSLSGPNLVETSAPHCHTKESWNCVQPVIYQLYIVQNLTLKTVIRVMKEEHDFVATPKMYTNKLKHWGYAKNARLQDVIEMQQQRLGDAAPMNTEVRRFVDAKSVQKYCRTNKLTLQARGLHPTSLPSIDRGTVRTAGRPFLVSPALPKVYLMEQLFLQHTKGYIRQSFVANKWSFRHNDALIDSSESQSLTRASIHSYLSCLELSCKEALEGRPRTSMLYWQIALKNVDALVQSGYHDVLPNLIRGISVLRQLGYHQNAVCLQAAITRKAHELDSEGGLEQQKILLLFKDLEPSHLFDFEERLLEVFRELFEWHLGSTCYSSFVATMNHARIRLLRNSQLQLEKCLPNVEKLDQHFGPSDRRSMDVIREMAEHHFDRRDYEQALSASSDLIARAYLRADDDEWLHHYFLLKGLYLRGGSEFHIGLDNDGAMASLQKFITVLDQFDKMEPACIFRPERTKAYEWLEQLSLRTNHPVAATKWQDRQVEESLILDAMDRFVN